MDGNIQKIKYYKVGEKTTICLLTLYNGFEVVGSSACIKKEDFNFEIGKELALERAKGKLNELLGFWMQEKYFKEIKNGKK